MLSLFMSNQYFRFRQFTVWQNRSAMKVCTDACLFGAWAAGFVSGAGRILDIGSGTGLLSLMLAQKTSARVDAVELDEDAASQAAGNFAASPWKNRLNIIHQRIQDFAHACETRYDFVISNPPFYDKDLKSPDPKRNLAWHNGQLSLDELFILTRKLLSGNGMFAVLIPAHRSAELEGIAEANEFHIKERIDVRQTPAHSFFRTMYLFYKGPPVQKNNAEISIKDRLQQYTPAFGALLKEYYLVFNNALS